MRFLDTNVFIRFLSQDDPAKAEKCSKLFERLSRNDEEVMTCEAVVAEVVYVMSSKKQYGLSAEEIHRLFSPLLEFRGLRLAGKARCIRALEIYAMRPSIGFEDAIIAAHMEAENVAEIYSYDSHFDGLPPIERIEP